MCRVPSWSCHRLCCMKEGITDAQRGAFEEICSTSLSLCERIKPGPFTASDCHSGNRLLGDLCQMLRLKAQALSRTRSSHLHCRAVFFHCLSVCQCSLMSGSTVSPRCSTPRQGCVLRNPPPCHPRLHASSLHLLSLRDPQCPQITFTQGDWGL